MLPVRDNVRTRGVPVVVLLLAAACVFVFLKELHLAKFAEARTWRDVERAGSALDALIGRCALFPERVADGLLRPLELVRYPIDGLAVVLSPLFTSLFLHGGVGHLLANLWFLWVFGRSVEARLGAARFLALYLLAGTLAGLCHVLFMALGREVSEYAAAHALPIDGLADRLRVVANDFALRLGVDPFESSRIPTIGASGAIAGVLGAYALLFPRARVITIIPPLFFLPFEVPALVFLGLWLASQAFGLWDALERGLFEGTGGIAYGAHFGGFALGIALALALRPRPPRAPAAIPIR